MYMKTQYKTFFPESSETENGMTFGSGVSSNNLESIKVSREVFGSPLGAVVQSKYHSNNFHQDIETSVVVGKSMMLAPTGIIGQLYLPRRLLGEHISKRDRENTLQHDFFAKYEVRNCFTTQDFSSNMDFADWVINTRLSHISSKSHMEGVVRNIPLSQNIIQVILARIGDKIARTQEDNKEAFNQHANANDKTLDDYKSSLDDYDI